MFEQEIEIDTIKKSKHLAYAGYYHVVFCPKYRHNIFCIKELDNYVKNQFIAISKIKHFDIIEMETDKNHVHLLISCNPRFGILSCVHALKFISAYHTLKQFPQIKQKYFWNSSFWSRGTYIATVGKTDFETIRTYIKNQQKRR